jgi:hypothetical protein
MAKSFPSQGGCWFCHQDGDHDKWSFSFEWDAYYHHKCFKRAYLAGSEEAEVIYRNEWDEDDRKYFETIEV